MISVSLDLYRNVTVSQELTFFNLLNRINNVTSRGEREPQSMEIQYSRANIKGDMSNLMKNSEHFI